ncbi:hypothetical protein L9F63_002126, partial [Diploptera punctata]
LQQLELDLTNGQLTPNNNTPLLTQALSVMNNYQAAAAAAAQGFGPPASPHAAAAAAAANSRGGFPPANSPGPIDMYSSSAADSVAGYVQAASPQPSGFPTIATIFRWVRLSQRHLLMAIIEADASANVQEEKYK